MTEPVKSQRQKFIETARELGCDEDPEAFERVFARVVPPKRAPIAATKSAGMQEDKRKSTRRKQTRRPDG